MTTSRDRVLADFARAAPRLPGAQVPWLARARQSALERFAQNGFPTSRDEEWKYTNVAAIEKRFFTGSPQAAGSGGPPPLDAFASSHHRLVFIDGRFAPALSAMGDLPAGVTLKSLASVLERAPDALERPIGEDRGQTVFAALNTTFMMDGAYLHVPRGTAIEEPIDLVFVATGKDAAIYPRNVIIADQGAQATVVEHYAGANGISCFTNAVTQLFAAENASVEHYKLQQEPAQAFHIAGIHAAQSRDSRFLSHSISLGAAIARNDISTTFDAEGCEATLNGLYLARGRQHVDHHTRIDHARPNGTSREFYRGLLDGASRGVFNGKVIVHPQASGSDAHQLNRNLLLSKDAEVDTKPQLEIYADDVKCTHGATVGQLDEAQLFYLRSRGIEEAVARSLLVYAFARDVIERIRVAPLRERVNGQRLVYLDNGATTQKPQAVIDAEAGFYSRYNANVHRAVHTMSQRATEAYEAARGKVQRFLNAMVPEEIVFVRGTTEAINLVAQSYARPRMKPGDEIVISAMEHHSNIVPWQMVCAQSGAVLRVVPINDAGELDLEAYASLIGPRTRLVAMTHVSNALGSLVPVARVIALAHERNVPVLLDGAQAVAHLPVDVRALDCDFYAFSGHKIFGPTGIGVLYGKRALLEAMPPWQGGGDMIRSVTFERTEYNELPYKFEAGTPNIAGVVGLGAALDYVCAIGFDSIGPHESDLLRYATQEVSGVSGLRIIGTAKEKAGILSFTMEGVHPHDIGTILDQQGIAIRAGHHCAMPVMQRYGIAGTARASFALYNTRGSVDALVAGLHKVREMFQR